MRKLLFGGTALVGAVMLAGAASAQTAGPKAPFTAILDGEVNGNMAILSGTQNSGANGGHQRDFGFEQNAWMRFFFEGKADNGLTYGWYVRIIGTSSGVTRNGFANDRESMYFRHPTFGTIEFGNGTASGKQGFPFVRADWGPTSSSQSYLGPDGKLEGEFLQLTDTRAFQIFNSFIKVGSDNAYPSGRAMHIWYGSPEFAGFSLNGDYTPDGRSRNEENFQTDTTIAAIPAGTFTQNLNATNFQNIVSINLQYKGTIGPVALAGGLQYAHAQSKNVAGIVAGREFSNQALRDVNSYEAGFNANYAGFQFGLNGTFYGKSNTPKRISGPGGLGPVSNVVDTWGWSTGLEYFTGPWVIGGYYWYGRAPGTVQVGTIGTPITIAGGVSGNGLVEFNYYAAGVGYTLAPGLKVYAQAFYYNDYNTHVTSVAGNSGYHPHGQIYIFGTSFAW